MVLMEKIPLEYKPINGEYLDEVYPSWKNKKQVHRGNKWVDIRKIKGTISEQHIHNFFSHRFFRAKKWLEDKKYDFNQNVPVLFKINNEYFVATNGNHRVLVFKYLKIEKIKAEIFELI